MDKDWAEKEANDVIEKLTDDATRQGKYKLDGLVLYNSDWDYLKELVSEALRKVRREAIESCAVIAEKTCIYECSDAQITRDTIRESEGNV